MNDHPGYLCLAITLMLVVYFVYLFVLDGRIRNLKQRLEARESAAQSERH